MLDDLLANEVGSALDDAVHAFSPESHENISSLPPGSSPTININQVDPMSFSSGVGGSRGSFSAQGGQGQPLPNLAHRGSLSVHPRSGITSQRNSFSAQGEAPLTPNGLPGDGRTKGIMLDQLPSFDASTHSAPDSANGLQTPFAFGVADIHHKFMESMKSQDERELGEGSLGGGGRLEMLLGEMVDDGDGDGTFGGVAGMGMLGGMGSSGLGIGAGVGVAGTGIGYVNDFGGVGVGW